MSPFGTSLRETTDYEMGVFTAQVWDWKADRLDRGGGLGGARRRHPRFPFVNKAN